MASSPQSHLHAKQGGLSLFCCDGTRVSFGFVPFVDSPWSLSLTLLVSANMTLSVRALVFVFLADFVLDYFLRPDSVCYVAPGRHYIMSPLPSLHFRIVLFDILTDTSAVPLAF